MNNEDNFQWKMMIIFNEKGNWKCKTRSVQLFIMALSFWVVISFWTFKRVWIFNEHLNNKFNIVEKLQLSRILQWKISVKERGIKVKNNEDEKFEQLFM